MKKLVILAFVLLAYSNCSAYSVGQLLTPKVGRIIASSAIRHFFLGCAGRECSIASCHTLKRTCSEFVVTNNDKFYLKNSGSYLVLNTGVNFALQYLGRRDVTIK